MLTSLAEWFRGQGASRLVDIRLQVRIGLAPLQFSSCAFSIKPRGRAGEETTGGVAISMGSAVLRRHPPHSSRGPYSEPCRPGRATVHGARAVGEPGALAGRTLRSHLHVSGTGRARACLFIIYLWAEAP